MTRERKAFTIVIASILFFLSGWAALVYQVLWMKELSLLFGNSSQAAAATLAAFFTGIAAGNAYWGCRVSKLTRPLFNREKLGVGSKGKTDSESGIYANSSDIQQLTAGDVALLKGESWMGNEGGGLVHRSPQLSKDNKRLLLTLDFI